MNKRNDFICIGAVHPDYLLRLKQNYFKNRTNPIIQQEKLGGVAYNIAKKLSFLDQNTKLFSMNCNPKIKKELEKNGIKFQALNNNISESYYASIIDKKGSMIFGLANMQDYEKITNNDFIKKYINKNIILDLNLSTKLIKDIINKNAKKNYICICGTSAHKVYKIKNLLNKIDTIILNKQEGFNLTDKKSIKDSMNYLIKKNKKLNVIITNGKNAVNAYLNEIFYLSYPPLTNVKDENGAGDALSAIFNYFYCNSLNELCSLNKAISGGSLEASKYKNKKENYLQKIDKLSRSIKFKIIKKYE